MTDYHLDYGAFRREVLQADFMVGEVEKVAERIKDEIVATAPERTGHYRSSFSTRTRKRGGIHNDRAEAQVTTSDPGALAIEFGRSAPDGSHVEGHYTMTRAIDAGGA